MIHAVSHCDVKTVEMRDEIVLRNALINHALNISDLLRDYDSMFECVCACNYFPFHYW